MDINTVVLIENMDVHVIRKDFASDIYSTTAPLNYVLKLFGLSCISDKGVKLKYSWSTMKIIFLNITFISLSFCCIFFKFKMDGSNIEDFLFRDSVQFSYLFDHIHYAMDIALVYKYGRQSYVDYYTSYDHIDQLLHNINYVDIKRSVNKICIYFIIISLTTMVCDYLAWFMLFGWLFPMVYLMDFFYLVLKMLSYLDVISHCTHIEYRLKCIKESLELFYRRMESINSSKDLVNVTNFSTVYITQTSWMSKDTFFNSDFLFNINTCYLLLLEQCDYINKMFGYRIMVGNGVSLFNIVIVMNLAIRILTGTLAPEYDIGYFPVISTIMRICTLSIILLCTVQSCERTYGQSRQIVRMIDRTLMNKKMRIEVRETLKELRDLITTRPINFTGVDFYRLDYPTLVSLTSVIITYTIIMLQHMK